MSRVHICKIADVPENGMKGFDVAGRRVLIAQSGDAYYAYQGICPHQEVCLDEGFYDGSVLTCHQHLWQWDITTGAPVGLAEAPLERYDVQVDDGDLYVVQGSALHSSELFAGVSDAALAKLSELCRREEHEAGSVLYDVGGPADDLYILESGRVDFMIGRGERTSAAGFMLKKGEVFGWNALLDAQPTRIARAKCLERSALLRLSGKEALRVFDDDAVAGFNVMRNLSNLITRYLTLSGAK
ncbi:MAG: Rieske 2Fe-2S domain-containing protein [Caldimonas sp.]